MTKELNVMNCFLKATITVELDETNEELQENAELVQEYIQNWTLLPQTIQQVFQEHISDRLKFSLKVEELRACKS